MRLESGPAGADRNYWAFVTVLCLVMLIWFVYDGLAGWPNKNRKEARNYFSGLVEGELTLPKSPTEPEFKAFEATKPTTVQQVREKYGEPTYVQREGARVVSEQYASLYGVVIAQISEGNQVTKLTWHPWAKTKEAIEGQFYWALIPLVIGAYTILKLYRAATLRVSVDDDKLVYASQTIPLTRVTALRDYNPKGWVDLYYQADGENERRLRLDNQKIARFDEVVGALCQAKGFENPLTKPADEESDATSERSADDAAPDTDAEKPQ